MTVAIASFIKSKNFILTSKSFSLKFSFIISPTLEILFSDSGITLCRTVAICGLKFGETICAIILPPKAGRVCIKIFLSLSISKPVQSAVKPAYKFTAIRETKLLPVVVAPARIISGLYLSTKLTIAFV